MNRAGTALVANARMYTVNAAVATRWHELFAWIAERAQVALDVIEHRPPAALEALWCRSDLGSAIMCGYPLATWHETGSQPVPIAVPAPSAPPFVGRAVYWTDIVVRADSRFHREDDLAGARFGWTVEGSQSGYQAPRRHFAQRALARGGRFFGAAAGPLVTPRRVVDSIAEGSIDAGPLDAYWHALLRLHEPGTADLLRVIGRTDETPLPCFVTASATPVEVRERLMHAFADASSAVELRDLRTDLGLAAFAPADIGTYDILAVRAREVDSLGYLRLC